MTTLEPFRPTASDALGDLPTQPTVAVAPSTSSAPAAPAPTTARRRVPRLPRPYIILTTGGLGGVTALVSGLCDMGYRVPDFSVDVREGVSCSGVHCTVALTIDEVEEFGDLVRRLPGVVSVEPA